MKIIKIILALLFLQSCTSSEIKTSSSLGFSSKNNQSINYVKFEDKLYIVDQKGRISAIDLIKNERIWQVNLKKYGKYSTLDIDYNNDKIIVSNGINQVFLIDANSGNIVGSREFSATPISVKFLQDETIIVNTLNNKTYALLDMDSLIWVHESYNSEISTLGVADIIEYDDKIIVLYSSGEVYCLNQYNGSVIWNSDLSTGNFAGIFTYLSDIDVDAQIKDRQIYVANNNGIMKSFSLSDGQEVWEISLNARPIDFIFFENKIVLISRQKLFIIDSKNGKIEQEITAENVSKEFNNLQNISHYQQHLIVNNKDKIFILKSDGNLVKQLKSPNNIITKPIFYQGRLYYVDSGWVLNDIKYINFNGGTF